MQIKLMGQCRPTTRVVIVIAAIALATSGPIGCERSDPAGSGQGAASVAKSEPSARPPVTEEEGRAFAAAVEDAVGASDGAAFGALIDWDAVIKTGTAGIKVPESTRSGFVQGVKSSMNQEQGLVAQIIAALRGGGSYKLLHLRSRDKHTTALFRLVMPDSNGVNYHEFLLARGSNGKVRAVDIYIFLSGELLSQTMRRMYIPLAAQVSRGLLDRLLGTEQAFMKNFPKFQQMMTDLRGGRPGDALKIYEQFPPELKKDKNILLIRLQAAQALNDEEYERAIEDLRAAHPDDACIDMVSIDDYLLKKDYDRAFACLDRLDRAVGGDPYVDVMRASIHTDAKQYDLARQDARRAIDADPDLQDAYWTLVTIALEEHNFRETVTLLDRLDERFHIPFGDMTQLPVFSEFVRSPEYRAWKGRAEKKSPVR